MGSTYLICLVKAASFRVSRALRMIDMNALNIAFQAICLPAKWDKLEQALYVL